MKRRKKSRSARAKWIFGISCMAISAAVMGGIIFFSKAGRDEMVPGNRQEEESQISEKQGEDESNNKIQEKLEDMTLEEKVAQMFMVAPDALTGVTGTIQVGDITKEAYEDRPVGGLIMMGNNLETPEQTKEWNASMMELSQEKTGLPLFLSVDEEGGTVSRISGNDAFGVEDVGDMSEIGRKEDKQKAYDAGKTIGSYLKELGFNMDFAPLADVWTNPENTIVRERSFGSDPELVAKMAAEEIKGLHSQDIYTVTKHFPGHGGTSEDSHEGAAYSESTEDELEKCEFLPFKAAIEEGTEFIMAGHISLPNVLDDDTPASLSKEIITEMLREKLGYDGIVITDAMDMGAITRSYTSAEAAVKAVQAGADVILMPEDFEEAYQGILSAVSNGTLPEDRIDESVERILEVKMAK